MKKLFEKSSIGLFGVALIGAMLVLALAACPGDTEEDPPAPSGSAVLEEFQAVATDLDVKGTPGEAIPESAWNELTDKNGLTPAQRTTWNFNYSSSKVSVTLSVKAGKSTVTYAVVTGNAKPAADAFKALSQQTPELAANDTVYFKVVSEDKKVTNYYCVTVIGLANVPSASITSVTIGGGEAVNQSGLGGAIIDSVTLQDYTMPTANAAEPTIRVIRTPAGQVISWAKVAASAAPPADSAFTEFPPPESGNALLATVTAGLANGDKLYIKVASADGQTVLYFGFTISVGNIAELDSLSLSDEVTRSFGVAGSAWNTAGGAAFDLQIETPASGAFTLVAAAKDGGKVA